MCVCVCVYSFSRSHLIPCEVGTCSQLYPHSLKPGLVQSTLLNAWLDLYWLQFWGGKPKKLFLFNSSFPFFSCPPLFLSLCFAFFFVSCQRGRIRFSEPIMDICLTAKDVGNCCKGQPAGAIWGWALGWRLAYCPFLFRVSFRSVALRSWAGLVDHSTSNKGLLNRNNPEIWPSLLVYIPSIWP